MLEWLTALPPLLIYLVIGIGAAVENIVPPVPADTFVVLGAFLAARGQVDAWAVFLSTWVGNVSSAFLVYGLARRYGGVFFRTPFGHWLLHPKQLEQIAVFYARWGTPAIFGSRFLPGLRAMVPVFAGISQVTIGRVVPPVALASAIWYGILVYLGAVAGRGWGLILERLRSINDILLWIALAVGVILIVWWLRTRAHPDH